MRKMLLLTMLLFLVSLMPLVFSATEVHTACFDDYASCAYSCCESAGGTFNREQGECEWNTQGNIGKYDVCVSKGCTPTLLKCTNATEAIMQKHEACQGTCASADESAAGSCYKACDDEALKAQTIGVITKAGNCPGALILLSAVPLLFLTAGMLFAKIDA